MIRLHETLHREITDDLTRPHATAAERIGFALGTNVPASSGHGVVLLSEYHPVSDDHYVDVPLVGAAISSEAMRKIISTAMKGQQCIYHIHAHEFGGEPRPSRDDLQGYAAMLPACCGAVRGALHGAIILGRDSALGMHWITGNGLVKTQVTIVGFPVKTWSMMP